MKLQIKKLNKEINLPNYAHPGDAGLDLFSSEDVVLKAGESKVVKTGISMAIPEGHVGLVWDKSGLAAKNAIHAMAGVVDCGYRGEVGVVLKNLGAEDFVIEKNMKIAQMLIQPVVSAAVEESDSLEDTSRGEGGFGSTGK